MSDYNAGRARAQLTLDISPYEQEILRAKQLAQTITNIKTPALGASSGGISSAVNQQRQYATSLLQSANAQARLAQVQNTGKSAATGLAQAEQIYLNVLKQLPDKSTQATRALTNLQIVRNRLANVSGGGGPALPRTLEEFGGTALNQLKTSFLGILGPAALVTGAIRGVQSAISGAGEAVQASIALNQTKNALAAVAGDFKTYNIILNEAKQQQILFGGSLNENLEGLQGLATVAKATGADLGTLVDLQRRLTLLNSGPTGGAQGARIALANALSGQVTSLQRRFDIPVDQLKGLNDTSKTAAERLDIVNQFLDKVGITSASVETRVDQNAKAFNRLGQEMDTLKTNAGALIGDALLPFVNTLSTLVGVINSNPEAFLKLDQLFNGQTGNNQITKENLANVQAGIAIRAAKSQVGGIDFADQNAGIERIGNQRAEIENLLVTLNNAGGRAKDLGDVLTNTFSRDKTQKTEDYVLALKKLVKESITGKIAVQESKDALAEELVQKVKSQQHTADLADLQRQLANDSKLAAQGLLGAGDQALLMADKYNLAKDEAQKLIDKQAFLLDQGTRANVKNNFIAPKATPEETAAGLADQRAGERTGTTLSATEFNAQAKIAADIRERKRKEAEDAAKDAQQIQDAANALALEKAKTHQGKVAELGRQLSAETDPVKRLELQRDIQREQNAIEDEKGRKLKSVSSELNKQVGLQERIYDSLNKQQRALLDIDELTIKNRQETRKEERDIAQSNRILADPRKAKLQDAAKDAIALINVQRQQRLLEIEDKQATAGGTLFNGRILQSRAASGVTPVSRAASGPVPTQTAGQAAATRAITQTSAGQTVHLVVSDAGFKTIAEYTGPLIFSDGLVELERANSAGQGKAP